MLLLLQDCVTRYAHMTGYHVERKWGWDTHGQPSNLCDVQYWHRVCSAACSVLHSVCVVCGLLWYCPWCSVV